MTRRILLRLAFDGHPYHGTQRQPNVPTVNDAILDALDAANALAPTPNLRAQGRLDAGVSARDHVLAVNTDASLSTIAQTIAGRTDGIVPWAGAQVHRNYDPRFTARSRTYRYHLPDPSGLDIGRVQATWRLFEGHHCFEHFARLVPSERDQHPNRYLSRARLRPAKQGFFLEASAPTFLRHQVRRMVGTTLAVARGEIEPESIQDALNGERLATHHMADAAGLTLWRVRVPADWRSVNEAEAIARERLATPRAKLRQRGTVLDTVAAPTRKP